MESKFKFWAYFMALIAIFFSFLLLSIVFSGNIFNPKTPELVLIVIGLFFSFVWSWLVFGELRSKAIYIKFGYSSFDVKRYLSLGPSKTYLLNDIDGYKISFLSSNSGTYEYLYLMNGDKKVIKLSEFYHKNFKELKQEVISQNVNDLGFERFNYLKEFKEIFQSNSTNH